MYTHRVNALSIDIHLHRLCNNKPCHSTTTIRELSTVYLDTQSNCLKNININYHNIYYCYYSTFIKIYPFKHNHVQYTLTSLVRVDDDVWFGSARMQNILLYTLVCHKYVMMLPRTSLRIINSSFFCIVPTHKTIHRSGET